MEYDFSPAVGASHAGANFVGHCAGAEFAHIPTPPYCPNNQRLYNRRREIRGLAVVGKCAECHVDVARLIESE